MSAHFSIPSKAPRETALFFAAVIDGVVFDFPIVPDASIAVANDGSGLAVEVHPEDMVRHLVEVLIPKETSRHQAFMNPEGCRAMFGESVSPAPIASGRR